MQMAKIQQILDLEPSEELLFKGPFNEFVKNDIKLTNPSDSFVYFKVKTTVPRFYCVRPNSGIIKPNSKIIINVMLQIGDQNLEFGKKHKFMIQSAFSNNDNISVETFWKHVDSAVVMDSKLRVVFCNADGEIIENTEPDLHADPNLNISIKASAPPLDILTQSKSQDIQTLLQKEMDLRKMYQEEKNNLERENNLLLDKVYKFGENAKNITVEGFPLLHVVLVALFALLIGIIFGKILF